MPIYEYQCRKCGSVSSYLERRNQWRILGRKCGCCGSRRTRRILSTFSCTVKRTRIETLNELQHLGPVRVAPRPAPPESCPYRPQGNPEGDPTNGPEREPRRMRKGPVACKP
ncbi:MAG: FmdB family zinc ribbon protein [bacterium]